MTDGGVTIDDESGSCSDSLAGSSFFETIVWIVLFVLRCFDIKYIIGDDIYL